MGGVHALRLILILRAEEVDLLHALAKQLPDDDLLYGKGELCHASSRLARAELAHDHITSVHLRSLDSS